MKLLKSTTIDELRTAWVLSMNKEHLISFLNYIDHHEEKLEYLSLCNPEVLQDAIKHFIGQSKEISLGENEVNPITFF